MPELPMPLYMIPGSATDRRMFAPQLDAFPGMRIPEWLSPRDLKEPLASYARRLARSIDTSQPFALGGVSLGGMIAQEMAQFLDPVALILISTAPSSQALPLSRRLAGRLTRAMPDAAVGLMLRAMAHLVLKSSTSRRHIYASMLRQMPPRLVRWQSGAATEWTLKGMPAMPVFHLHGGKDRIIPVKNVKPYRVIEEGGHLINATHEVEVNRFIQESLQKLAMAQRTVIQAIQ